MISSDNKIMRPSASGIFSPIPPIPDILPPASQITGIETPIPASLDYCIDDSYRFVNTLDPDTDMFDFRIIFNDGIAKKLRGTLKELSRQLKSANTDGAGIYVTINKSDGLGTKKENIILIRAIMLDYDDPDRNNLAEIRSLPIKASLIVNTSPGKYHAYFFTTDFPIKYYSNFQNILNIKYNTDKSINDITRIMRLAGYNHTKTLEHFMSNIIEQNNKKYTFEELKVAFGITDSQLINNDLSSSVSNVSSNTEDIRKNSAIKRAECVKNIIEGKDLHDSTLKLTSSLMYKYNLDPNNAINEVQAILNQSNAIRDTRYWDRYNDIPRIANDWYEKQKTLEEDDYTWPEINELKKNLSPVEPLDFDSLPVSFLPFITDNSERMQCPPDYLAIALFITAATVIGKKMGITPKQLDDWYVVPNLWGMIIGSPSSLKTPSLNEALKFLKAFEKEAHDTYTEEENTYQVKLEIAEIRSKSNKKRAKEYIDNNNDSAAEDLLAEMIEPHDPPKRKRYIINDATVEKLGELLNDNPNGFAVYRDEISGFLNSLDKDQNSNDRSFYLEAWNGNGSYTYDRIGRGTIDIESTTINILGGIQPSKIKAYVHGAVNSTNSDDGLIQRFQLAVYPDPKISFEIIDRYPNSKIKNEIGSKLRALNEWEPIKPEVNIFGDTPKSSLKFSPDTQDDFNKWFTTNEHICRDNQHPALESHFSKYRSLVPSISLIIELFDCNDLNNVKSVSKESLTKAIRFVEYLRSHAYRIYGMASNPEIDNAIIIKDRFNKLPNPFRARDIYRKCWVGLSSKESTLKALELLEENNYCRSVLIRQENGGKSYIDYYKHESFVKDTN